MCTATVTTRYTTDSTEINVTVTTHKMHRIVKRTQGAVDVRRCGVHG
jgi:hypothetical protein